MDPKTDVDEILYALGRTGKYQKLQLALLAVFTLENCFHLISPVFIGYRPDYRCADINESSYLQHTNGFARFNETDIDVRYGKCDIDITVNSSSGIVNFKEDCINGYKYGIPEDRSTVTEWNLVCKGAERSEFAQTLFMLGQALGALIFSPLADKFGRKTCNVVARITYFLTALVTVFTPNIDAFLAFRLLQGTFQGGCVMTSTILYIELMPKELRHVGEAIVSASWTTGLVLASLIGYLARNISWRYMQLILALITAHSLIDWLFIDESLRWLLANGRIERAEQILKKACRINKVSYESVVDKIRASKELIIKEPKNGTNETKNDKEPTANNTQEEAQTKVETYSILTLLKHKRILLMSMVLWISWITNTLTYYGLMLTASKLSGDRFLNIVLSCLAEFPTIITVLLLVNRIGRKKMLIFFHSLAAVSLVLATVCTTYKNSYNWLPTMSTVCSLIGKYAITGSFSTVFLYSPELYPTNMRNAGLGMASMVSRIGSMMSPFAITLAEHISWGPAAVFGSMNVLVSILLLPLPETMGRELPTTLTELKTWYKSGGYKKQSTTKS